jgi:hypothetical protein
MDIVRLPDGVAPDAEVNCITIQRGEDGRFHLNGTVLMACGDADGMESVSLMGIAPYATFEEAEAAGLAWAQEHCADEVVVATVPFSVADSPV